MKQFLYHVEIFGLNFLLNICYLDNIFTYSGKQWLFSMWYLSKFFVISLLSSYSSSKISSIPMSFWKLIAVPSWL